MKKVFKAAVTAFGCLFTLFYIICCLKSNFNLGCAIVLIFGFIITGWYLVPDNRFFRILKTIIAFGSIIYISVALFIFFNSRAHMPDYKEDAVIVLGCGVRKTTPSIDLRLRLDKAADYYDKNPDCVICVSGGQGPQEDIAEAEAMSAYLIQKGIPEYKIIEESESASTYENFLFSKSILDNFFGKTEYRIVYITNDFHSYRAGLIARKNGFTQISAYPSQTGAYMLIPNYMREVLAVFYAWVFY